MASGVPFPCVISPVSRSTISCHPPSFSSIGARPLFGGLVASERRRTSTTTVSAIGDVSADSTNYLIGGAIVVALVGTAFPIFFSRKDICPECDGAGFVRRADITLRANAARKDQTQIVCARCSGLGKLGQIDK